MIGGCAWRLTLLSLHVCLLIISLIIKKKKCLARSSRVGDLKTNTRTPHARSCTAPQSNAVPAKRDNKRHSNQKYIKNEVVLSARPLPRLAPHTHTWDKTFEPIRMLKRCCLDTMKNNSCIISGATNESRPPNLIVLYTRITATAPFYSTQAMVEPTS